MGRAEEAHLVATNYGDKDWEGGEPVTGTPMYCDVQQPDDGAERFIVQGYKDVWAAVLFVLAIAGAGVGVAHALTQSDPFDWDGIWTYNETDPSFQAWKAEHGDKYKLLKSFLSTSDIQYWAAGAAGGAFVYILGALLLMYVAPRCFIQFFTLLFAVVCGTFGVCSFLTDQSYGGFILCIFALVPALYLCCHASFIPFASLLLDASMTIIARWKALIFVAVMQLVILTGCMGLFVVSLKPWIGKYSERFYIDENGDVASTVTTVEEATTGPLIGMLFVAIWATQVIATVVHVTTCGVAATWFFYSATGLPRNATWKSYARAVSTSFGSICFGSLVVAILQFIRMILRAAMRNKNGIVQCLALCLVSCIENMMRYFNKWAFVHVAVYGKSYIDAAKATWSMMMDGTIWAGVVSDIIVDFALSMVNILGFIIAFAISFGVTKSIFVAVAASMFTVFTCQVVVGAVDSCIKTVFVCYAEAGPMPAATHPELVEGIAVELRRQETEA